MKKCPHCGDYLARITMTDGKQVWRCTRGCYEEVIREADKKGNEK